MKNLTLTIFVLTFWVNSSFSQLEGFSQEAPRRTKEPKEQKFDGFGNFRIENGLIYWQNVYQCQGMSKDSILTLIMSATKADSRFTFINDRNGEITFFIIKKPILKGGFINNGKITVEAKAGKYRVTFSDIEIHGDDPQNALDNQKKYFLKIKFQYLIDVDNQFIEAFDFKNYPKSNTLTKDW